MDPFSSRKIVSVLITLLLLLSSCSQIQEPAPDPTRDLPLSAATEPATAPVSTPMTLTETPVLEMPAGAITPTQGTTLAATEAAAPTLPASCLPTPPDALGPFYEPGAPVRDKVGEGYLLSGVVRSSDGCAPIPGAQIEIWMAGPDGNYTDDYRAILFSDENGAYRFESHFPPPYSGRPPHHHLMVSAEGYQTLVTQHYPIQGETEATFDIVLVPD